MATKRQNMDRMMLRIYVVRDIGPNIDFLISKWVIDRVNMIETDENGYIKIDFLLVFLVYIDMYTYTYIY